MEQKKIEEYASIFEQVLERVGDVAIAVPILQELGKDRRMEAIRAFQASDSKSRKDDAPATEKQLAFLRSLGGEATERMTKAEASKQIDELLNGRE